MKKKIVVFFVMMLLICTSYLTFAEKNENKYYDENTINNMINFNPFIVTDFIDSSNKIFNSKPMINQKKSLYRRVVFLSFY